MQANCCGWRQSTALDAGGSRQHTRGRAVVCPRRGLSVGSSSRAAGWTDRPRQELPCGKARAPAQQRVCKHPGSIGAPAGSWDRDRPHVRCGCSSDVHGHHRLLTGTQKTRCQWGAGVGRVLCCPACLQGLLPASRLLCKWGFTHLSGAGELQGQS